MNRGLFIHYAAICAAGHLAALRGPIYLPGIGNGEAIGLVLTPAECAQRARAVALALAEAFDVEHEGDTDALEDEPWGGR
jgi:hypothetical protein